MDSLCQGKFSRASPRISTDRLSQPIEGHYSVVARPLALDGSFHGGVMLGAAK